MPNPLSADLDHILEHTRELWEDLRGERMFITGGTGFFGKWLLESLIWANDRLNLNCQATVLSRFPDRFRANAPRLAEHEVVSVWKGDVRNFEFPHGEYRAIIHAATESSAELNREKPLEMLDTIITGTRHTLDFAHTCRAEIFLLTSSGAVYGKQPAEMAHIFEEYTGGPDPLDPKSAYGEGKRVAEHLCTLYGDAQLKPKIARCFAFVGPYLPLKIHFAIGNFLSDAIKGGPIVVKGDGTPRRSYLYAADLVIWLWTICLRGKENEAFNVGSEQEISIKEAAQSVADCFTQPPSITILGIPKANTPPERYIPSIKKAKIELGLDVWISFEEALRRTIRFHENQ